MEPFVMIPKKFADEPWFKTNVTKVLLWLLCKANVTDAVSNGITIHRGERGTSYRSIAEATGLTYQQVRDTVENMIRTGLITRSQHGRMQVISICSFDTYQGREQGREQDWNRVENRVGPQMEQQINNKEYIDSKPVRPELTEWFTAFFREYPNKNHQTEAFAEFTKMDPDAKQMTVLYEALKHHKNSIAWNNEDGRFVPRMDKWLREEQWKRRVPQQPDPYNGLKNFDLSED